MIGGLVLAAGAATRFGSAKQLAELDGLPLLEHAVRAMAQAPGVMRSVVVLGAEADEVIRRVPLHGLRPVVCPRWEEGQSASLAAGLAAVGDCEAVVVTLGDQPRLAAGSFERVLASRGAGLAVRATYGGVPGHPVLLERELFGPLRDVTGDHGARNLLRSVGTVEVECDDLCGGEDVDSPDQLAALCA